MVPLVINCYLYFYIWFNPTLQVTHQSFARFNFLLLVSLQLKSTQMINQKKTTVEFSSYMKKATFPWQKQINKNFFKKAESGCVFVAVPSGCGSNWKAQTLTVMLSGPSRGGMSQLVRLSLWFPGGAHQVWGQQPHESCRLCPPHYLDGLSQGRMLCKKKKRKKKTFQNKKKNPERQEEKNPTYLPGTHAHHPFLLKNAVTRCSSLPSAVAVWTSIRLLNTSHKHEAARHAEPAIKGLR